MAITVTPTSYFEYKKLKGEIDFNDHTIKAILMGENFSFDRDKHKVYTATSWEQGSYTQDELVTPTDPSGEYVMKCAVGGNTASGEPDWPVSGEDPFGNTVVDNEVTWEVWSYNTISGEISSSGNYTAQSLSIDSIIEDESGNLASVQFNDINFTASGEAFDICASAIFYDDTDPEQTIICGIDFGNTYEVSSGSKLTLKNPKIQDKSIQTTG